MKFVYWVFAAIMIVAAVLFALSNRQLVEFGIWPLPFVVEIPAYGFGLGAFAVGFFCGGFVIWLRAIGARTRAGMNARSAERLQRELDALQARDASYKKEDAPSTSVVAVPETPISMQKSVGAS